MRKILSRVLVVGILLGYAVSAYGQEGLRDRRRDPAGGPTPPAATQSGDVGTLHRPLAGVEGTLWNTPSIPVCWENPSPADAAERGWVRAKITATWEANSQVRFTGWGPCTSASRGVRIRISTTDMPSSLLGKRLDGVPSGMHLNLTGADCPLASHQRCIEAIAAHEFGHALGFGHEQNRPDAPAWCRDKAQGPDPVIYMTRYDESSIMNYCNPNWDNNGNLSQADIAGLQFWYGPNPNSGIPWRPDCRHDAVLFQDKNYGGKALKLYGSMQELTIESFNDRASSLCVPAGYGIRIYADKYYKGASWAVSGPWKEPSLSAVGWNDRISSVRIIDLRHSPPVDVYEAQHECQTDVLIFEHSHFKGASKILKGDAANLSTYGFNDKVTSLCVPPGKTITLFRDKDFKGRQLTFRGPKFIQNLGGWDWNDKVSSIKVR